MSTAANSRRTFAIISHPDAGKTTLTEKLLLKGGAIHLAGEVKARGQARRARSDWMKIEQQLLGQRGLARVGVRDDRERAAGVGGGRHGGAR